MIKKLLVAVCALGLILGMTGCYSKPQSGEIGVVRNGGPFDNHKIRQVVPNGAGNTWVGWGSTTHYYPVDSQQRFFRLETCYDGGGEVPCRGADDVALTEPTSDGVEVGVEGTFYLNTNFNESPRGVELVKAFDTQFGTRTFNGNHAWEGNEGWSDFLLAIVEPVIQNNLRSTLSGITCAELVSSCALVQNSTGEAQAVDLTHKNNKSNVQRIQDTINQNLQTDLNTTLKNDYFGNIRFSLTKVVLPGKVQDAIDTAQASFAQVSQAAARVKSAKLDSQANEERQRGYLKCPTCAKIDAIRALPKNLQALGGNTAIGLK